MRRQPNFFDTDERLRGLSGAGDPHALGEPSSHASGAPCGSPSRTGKIEWFPTEQMPRSLHLAAWSLWNAEPPAILHSVTHPMACRRQFPVGLKGLS